MSDSAGRAMHTDPGQGCDETASKGSGRAATRVSCLSPELAGWGCSAACALPASLSAAQVCGLLASLVAGGSARARPAAVPLPWGPAQVPRRGGVPGGARPCAAPAGGMAVGVMVPRGQAGLRTAGLRCGRPGAPGGIRR